MEVVVSSFVFGVINVETVELKLTLDFSVTTEWYDDRLEFKDLNQNAALNSLSEEDISSIWTPRIVFGNSLGKHHTELYVVKFKFYMLIFFRGNEALIFDEKALGFVKRLQENGTAADMTVSLNGTLNSIQIFHQIRRQ